MIACLAIALLLATLIGEYAISDWWSARSAVL